MVRLTLPNLQVQGSSIQRYRMGKWLFCGDADCNGRDYDCDGVGDVDGSCAVNGSGS